MSIFYRCIQRDLKARDAKFPFATLVETDFGAVVVVVVFFLSSQWKGSICLRCKLIYSQFFDNRKVKKSFKMVKDLRKFL